MLQVIYGRCMMKKPKFMVFNSVSILRSLSLSATQESFEGGTLFDHPPGQQLSIIFWSNREHRSSEAKPGLSPWVFSQLVEERSVVLNYVTNNLYGDSKPFKKFKRITHKLVDAWELIDISLMDYVIIGHDHFTSFTNEGVLWKRSVIIIF